MAIPLRNLPLLQNWSCHGCTDCCRIEAPVSQKEKTRIEALDLASDPEIGPQPWFVRKHWWSRAWTLRRRPDGKCVFLTAANRCRLHERFGPEAKPLACRLFPFVLIPAAIQWRVGLHFMCPSAAKNQGKPITESREELSGLIPVLEKYVGRTGESAPSPPMEGRQQLVWADVFRFVDVLLEIVQDRKDPLEKRLRKCLALARICRLARFDTVKGARLSEFLHVVRSGLDAEVPVQMEPPGWLGRFLFRALLAIYARRDLGLHRGPDTGSSLARLRSGMKFVLGRGGVPRVNAFLPETTFEEVAGRPELPAESDETLERYYVVKLNSLQFCGPPNFNFPFWQGLESLVLTFPMILWLARAIGGEAALTSALQLVDDHFGGNPILGSRLVRFFLGTLVARGELEKLVAWTRSPLANG